MKDFSLLIINDFFRDRLSEIDDNLYQNVVTRTINASQSPSWPYSAVQTISPGQPYITIGNPGGDVGDLFSGVPIGASVLINEIDTGCYVRAVSYTHLRAHET